MGALMKGDQGNPKPGPAAWSVLSDVDHLHLMAEVWRGREMADPRRIRRFCPPLRSTW